MPCLWAPNISDGRPSGVAVRAMPLIRDSLCRIGRAIGRHENLTANAGVSALRPRPSNRSRQYFTRRSAFRFARKSSFKVKRIDDGIHNCAPLRREHRSVSLSIGAWFYRLIQFMWGYRVVIARTKGSSSPRRGFPLCVQIRAGSPNFAYLRGYLIAAAVAAASLPSNPFAAV